MTTEKDPRLETGGRGGRADEANDTTKPTTAVAAVNDFVRADSGAVLEWVEAHRDQFGWQPGKWEVVERALSVGARARPAKVELDHDVAQQLVSSSEFALAWTLAKDLAPLPSRLARSDMAASWEAISARVDPLLVLDTVEMIRAAAIERYVDAEIVARSVRRLLDDIERSTL